ncbi:helix-turn-helix domain-containing protein [Corynebacterium sp. A21]|uniref:helix-turn-helix domain-containing protein n=1 Tax=Corynebacterium sp. A21 TaxID=3457318 RepID=UPI003FD4F062
MTQLKDNNGTDIAATAREALHQLNHVLGSVPPPDVVDVVVESSEEKIRLPREVATILREILVNSAAGQAVGVIPLHAELTTQQAADLLNVSRPHVVKLMNDGVLPGHKVGTHRRIYAAEVQAYKHQRDIEGRIAADELTALTEEIGLYE